MGQPTYRLLGTLEVGQLGEGLTVPQLRRLLCRLLLAPGQAVGRDVLVDCLWPRLANGGSHPEGPSEPHSALRLYASRLRRFLPDATGPISVRGGYAIFVEPDDVDWQRFERLLAQSGDADSRTSRSGHATARRYLTEALELWRGEALADFRDESWATGVAARLDELRLVARERLSAVRLAMGEHDQLCGELESLVEEHPLREHLWAQLMLAQYRSGRQASALRAYQRLRDRLAEDLGIEPNPSLRGLELQILKQDPALDPPTSATAKLSPVSTSSPRPSRRGNLSRPATRFVGRRRELEELEQLVGATRLVSIVGPGGVGKTRLAVEVASCSAACSPDGVWFADLSPHQHDGDVQAAVADLLGIRLKGARGGLERALANERLLLVLDNCEHVLEGSAQLCESLVSACPGVSVLATSREPLRVDAERLYRLGPLELPPDGPADLAAVADAEAVELFVSLASERHHRFELTEANAWAVAELCRQVDGLPLAIEMAAARVPVLSPSQIVERLGTELKLIAQGTRRRTSRHQTLDRMIEWSYDLLDPREKHLLEVLSVFPGTFDLDAVEGISRQLDDQPVLDVITSLVDKSLVVVDSSPDSARYRLLVTVRRFAREMLASRGPVAREAAFAHASYFLDLAEEVEPRIYTSDQKTLLARMDLELDNLRAAVTFFAERAATAREAMRILVAVRSLLVWRGHEGWLNAMVNAVARQRGTDIADSLDVRFRFMEFKYLGHMDPVSAIQRMRDLLKVAETLPDRGIESEMLTQIAAYKWFTGDIEGASRLRERALRVAETSGSYIAFIAALNGPGASLEEMQRGAEIAVDAGDAYGRFMSLNNLGTMVFETDVARACTYFEEALAVAEAANMASLNPYTYGNLGYAYVLLGEADRAKAALARAWAASRRLQEDRCLLICLLALSAAEVLAGNYTTAASLTALVEKFSERSGFALDPGDQERLVADEMRLRLTLGDRAFDSAREAGRRMDPDEAVRRVTRTAELEPSRQRPSLLGA